MERTLKRTKLENKDRSLSAYNSPGWRTYSIIEWHLDKMQICKNWTKYFLGAEIEEDNSIDSNRYKLILLFELHYFR